MKNNNNLTFDKWMQKINKFLLLEIGLTTDDLPDMCYMDYYESGTSPEEMIEEIKEENDYLGE